jgi:hypothetical protein
MTETFLPELPCLCGNSRRTARALTQLYEENLRPLALRASQFTILQMLSRAGQLGEMLAMDSTSLTRTLAIMRRRGWIAERRGKDRRERRLRLGRAGKENSGAPSQCGVRCSCASVMSWGSGNGLRQLTQRATGVATEMVTGKGDGMNDEFLRR